MTEEEVRRRLADAQKAFRDGTSRLRLERQQAVMEARAAGWSKYKIAAAMGIKGPTVDSIIATATDSAGSDQ
jgi:DNA-directed RNA polymerase specialized sigma24 family protein